MFSARVQYKIVSNGYYALIVAMNHKRSTYDVKFF